MLDDVSVDEELWPDLVGRWQHDVLGVGAVQHGEAEGVVELTLVQVLTGPSRSLRERNERGER